MMFKRLFVSAILLVTGFKLVAQDVSHPGQIAASLSKSNAPAESADHEKQTGLTNLLAMARQDLHDQKYDQAIAKCDRLLSDFDFSPALVIRGYAYLTIRNYDMAIKDFTRAIDDKLSPNLFQFRGRAYFYEKDYQKAVLDFSQQLISDTNNAYVFLLRGSAYTMLNNYDLAISDFGQSIKSNPSYAEPYADRGWVYGKLGNYKKATTDFQSAVKINPNSVTANNNFAWLLSTCPDDAFRDKKKAVTLAENACKLTKNENSFCLGTLAAAYANAGDFKKAIRMQTKSMALKSSQGSSQDELTKSKKLLNLYEAHKPYRELNSTRLP